MCDLTFALAKGRMQNRTLELLRAGGINCDSDALNSRRLSVTDTSGKIRFIFVKPADVPVYVEHGTADCGVCGTDVLLEAESDVLQPLDLGIARCKIVVAVPMENQHLTAETLTAQKAFDELLNAYGMLRVATKYPHIARTHFAARGIPVEIIELSGSVELAPLIGLSDVIVDLVETGRTLEENGLQISEVIGESSGRLIVNRASYHLKSQAVADLIERLETIIKGETKERF